MGHKYKWDSIPPLNSYSGGWHSVFLGGAAEATQGLLILCLQIHPYVRECSFSWEQCWAVIADGGGVNKKLWCPSSLFDASSYLPSDSQGLLFFLAIGSTTCIGQQRWLLLQCHPQGCKPQWMMFSVGYYCAQGRLKNNLYGGLQKLNMLGVVTTGNVFWFPCHPA